MTDILAPICLGRIRHGHQCDSFLNKAFVVEGQNQALTKERKFQMLGELTIQEVE